MSEPIKVGDLVMVVGHCCNSHIGEIHTVKEIMTMSLSCKTCKSRHRGLVARVASDVFDDGKGVLKLPPLSWLKRIPPLSELDDVKKDEEIHA